MRNYSHNEFSASCGHEAKHEITRNIHKNEMPYLSVLLHTQTLDVHLHSIKHSLGINVHVDDLLLQSRHLGNEVQTALSLLLLELEGNSTHRSSLDSLHQML